jgi:hypothetical protein
MKIVLSSILLILLLCCLHKFTRFGQKILHIGNSNYVSTLSDTLLQEQSEKKWSIYGAYEFCIQQICWIL